MNQEKKTIFRHASAKKMQRPIDIGYSVAAAEVDRRLVVLTPQTVASSRQQSAVKSRQLAIPLRAVLGIELVWLLKQLPRPWARPTPFLPLPPCLRLGEWVITVSCTQP